MRDDVKARLLDAARALEGVERRTHGLDIAAYRADEDVRLIVERLFITLGEALNGASKLDPAIASALPELPRLIAFRNILVHGYARIDSALILALAQTEAAELRRKIIALLESDQGAS